jgi:hypothetical protein
MHLLPGPLKKAIITSWNHDGPDSPAFTAALDAAIRALAPKVPMRQDSVKSVAVVDLFPPVQPVFPK